MIKIELLSINITDICNMQCEFCLRGDGSNRKLNLSLIPRIFEGIDEIRCITITGGEPSCYVEAVTAIVDYLVEHKDNIHVCGLFIATNGKEYRQELVDAVKTMLSLYLESISSRYESISINQINHYNNYLDELFYMFSLAVSLDKFHEPIPFENWYKYRMSGVYSNSKEYDYSKGGIIARGRGASILSSMYRDYHELYIEHDAENIIAENVYITVDGMVFGDCDMSYEMEEYTKAVGDLSENTLVEIIQQHVTD